MPWADGLLALQAVFLSSFSLPLWGESEWGLFYVFSAVTAGFGTLEQNREVLADCAESLLSGTGRKDNT